MNKSYCLPQDGYVSLLNHGAFVTRLLVRCTINGQVYFFTSDAFPVMCCKKITIPKNSTNIIVNAEVYMLSSTWFTIFSKCYSTPQEICLLAYGLIGYARCIQIPCKSPCICNTIKHPNYNYNYFNPHYTC